MLVEFGKVRFAVRKGGGAVRVPETEVGAEPVEHGHEVVAYALYARLAAVDYVLPVCVDIFIARRLAEFYVLVHGDGFDHFHPEARVVRQFFEAQELFHGPDRADGLVVYGGDNARHSLYLLYVVEGYAVVFAVPAKGHLHLFLLLPGRLGRFLPFGSFALCRQFGLVFCLFLFEGKASLFALCLKFELARLFGEPLGLLLLAAQALFGLYPLYARGKGLGLLALEYLRPVALEELFDDEEHHENGARDIYARLYPNVAHGDHSRIAAVTGHGVEHAERERPGGRHYGAVYAHGKAVAAVTALGFDVVEHVRNHREHHVACGRGAEALQRHAHAGGIEIIRPYAGYYAARGADHEADHDNYSLAELAGERPDERHGDGHGHGAEHVYDGHRHIGIDMEAAEIQVEPVAEEADGAVFERA